MKSRWVIAAVGVAVLAGVGYKTGLFSHSASPQNGQSGAQETSRPSKDANVAPVPAVTVVKVANQDFLETVLVTGSLVPREEILVAPEIEGLRVLELKAEEGDYVKQGDILAVLVSESLDAQVAQNDASLARATAAIAQARSQIVEAEARVAESSAALERARPLVKDKYLAESVFDQREAAAKTAAAQLVAAQDGLKAAEAQKAQVEAQRRELLWRRGKTEVTAPADGIISRRGGRIGSIAVGAFIGSAGEPLFRLVARGEVELDAEVSETRIGKIKPGQHAKVDVSGVIAEGTVRLVSPEVDKATRLGRVRIFLGQNPNLRIGSFARGNIETARTRGLAVPQSAVLYGDHGASVQVVEDGKVATKRIETGLSSGGVIEVRSGLSENQIVVAKAGTFLRDGDLVRPVAAPTEVSEAAR